MVHILSVHIQWFTSSLFPRPPLFLFCGLHSAALPLPCIMVNANRRTKNGWGVGSSPVHVYCIMAFLCPIRSWILLPSWPLRCWKRSRERQERGRRLVSQFISRSVSSSVGQSLSYESIKCYVNPTGEGFHQYYSTTVCPTGATKACSHSSLKKRVA